MNQQVFYEHFTRVGLTVFMAENGKEGVEMVQNRLRSGKKLFDLIFMDIHMPVMDGLEATAKILALNTGIPIIAMTANVMSSDRDLYKKSGMQDCIGKPFTTQELWRCLLRFLEPVEWKAVNETQRDKLDEELQRQLRIRFVKENKNKYNEITEAIEAGDIKLAHRLAHTLKGNAGMLGNTRLQEAAANIERLLKNGQSKVSSRDLSVFESELNTVLDEYTPLRYQDQAIPHFQVKPYDAEEARKLFSRLESLLDGFDPECLDLIDNLRTIPGSDEVIRHMEDYDFEAALTALAVLKRILDTNSSDFLKDEINV